MIFIIKGESINGRVNIIQEGNINGIMGNVHRSNPIQSTLLVKTLFLLLSPPNLSKEDEALKK